MTSDDQWKFSNGWLPLARRVPSPNQDNRPHGAQPELIVIHSISLPPGKYGGGNIEALFTNTLKQSAHPYYEGIYKLKVSAHFLVERSGKLVQFVSTDARAWHAGESRWRGRENCNDFSIGIELEGCETDRYLNIQYEVLSALVVVLQKQYPLISSDAIVGHSNIAPGRKTDPGLSFDWRTLLERVDRKRGDASK